MDVQKITGLTEQEVQHRVAQGLDNQVPKAPTRTVGQIIRNNVFTFFNFINLVIVVLLVVAESYRNLLFIWIVIANVIIGIYQEINAKKTLEKLSLLNQPKVFVMREGSEKEIAIQEIVVDDILVLRSGMQISADAILLPGQEIEVDESLLTGEADPILKRSGEELLTGSFVVSGKAYAKANRVGANTYTAKLADEARKFKLVNSELREGINRIIKAVSVIIVPIGIFLAWSQLSVPGATWQDAIVGAVAGVIGMIPEGLVLLTSVAFAAGIVKLAKQNTLVQELPAIETLARVDMLCLDKTGTITEGVLDVAEIKPLGETTIGQIDEALIAFITALPDANPTQQALIDYYGKQQEWEIEKKIAFSSARKWSAVSFTEQGTWIVGAPEMVLEHTYVQYQQQIEAYAKQGQRVLILAHSEQILESEQLPTELKAVAIITLEDRIRPDAPATLAYFAEQGVKIKVISGDNPVTVSAVAKRAGLVGSENYLDARTLPEDLEQIAHIVEKTTVFGRVTPHQKKLLVQALQLRSYTVAMTGDGVNDVLALKEADCGIAMASGSDATKAVAQLVLLDSNFASLPSAVAEGRRVINNIQRVASLFLVKTLYSFILSILTIFMGFQYPFIPIQLSLISTLAVGVPSFFLALTPNNEPIKAGFLRRIIAVVIPAGTAIAFSIFAIYGLEGLSENGFMAKNTMVVLTAGIIQLTVLYRIMKPMVTWKWLLVVGTWIAFLLNFFTVFGRNFFDFQPLPFIETIIVISIYVVALVYIFFATKWTTKLIVKTK
ncbi:MAG: HAD-IC family P-type ATPase [Culicoidibacterales bacterium]